MTLLIIILFISAYVSVNSVADAVGLTNIRLFGFTVSSFIVFSSTTFTFRKVIQNRLGASASIILIVVTILLSALIWLYIFNIDLVTDGIVGVDLATFNDIIDYIGPAFAIGIGVELVVHVLDTFLFKIANTKINFLISGIITNVIAIVIFSFAMFFFTDLQAGTTIDFGNTDYLNRFWGALTIPLLIGGVASVFLILGGGKKLTLTESD